MKKMLFLVLLFPAIIFSQDLKYAEMLNNLTKEQMKELSDDIMSTFTVSQKFYGITKNSGSIYAVYYPVDLPDRIIKEDMKDGMCTLCNAVEFFRYSKGENKDLGIEGTDTYRFRLVSGKYLDLFGWWQKHFAPNVNKEGLLEKDSNLRYLEDRKKSIDLRFVKNMDDWEIRNAY